MAYEAATVKPVTEGYRLQSLTCAFTFGTMGSRMDLEAIGGAASIALLGSAVFALTARAWIALALGHVGRLPFSGVLLPESAQRFRDELELLGRKQSVLLASALAFAVLFAFALLSNASRMLSGADVWLLIAAGVIVVAGIAWGAYRLARVVLQRRRLVFSRNANIVVGQALDKITGDLNRVFHDVDCAGEIVDHVLVGLKGIYAIFVVARRPSRNNTVRVHDSRLWFAGRDGVALVRFAATADKLAGLFRKALGSRVRVRTVLVLPGWEIEAESTEDFLIVNERSLVMLRGWADRSEYLMNEDVESLHELLGERLLRRGRRRNP